MKKNSYCSFCGSKYPEDQLWPRTCSECGNTTFLNPAPVSVLLVPVDSGLLTIRRAIDPHRGMLALPGGYINLGETWREAGVREVKEETGLILDPIEITLFDVCDAPDGTLLIFGLAGSIPTGALPAGHTDDETSERVIVHHPADLAFWLHQRAAEKYFREQPDNKG